LVISLCLSFVGGNDDYAPGGGLVPPLVAATGLFSALARDATESEKEPNHRRCVDFTGTALRLFVERTAKKEKENS